MNAFQRGVQLYLFLLAVLTTVAVVWGTNRYALGNTAAETGWPLMIGIAVSVVVIVVAVRFVRAGTDPGPAADDYPW